MCNLLFLCSLLLHSSPSSNYNVIHVPTCSTLCLVCKYGLYLALIARMEVGCNVIYMSLSNNYSFQKGTIFFIKFEYFEVWKEVLRIFKYNTHYGHTSYPV